MAMCSLTRSLRQLLAGAALSLSVVSVTAWGSIAEDLWQLLRAVGSLALVAVWAGVGYEHVSCSIAYDRVPLIVGGVPSLLLGLTHTFVGEVDGYSVELLRYFVFSAFTHGMLLLLPRRIGSVCTS
jgi:hypothetical protein